jgi:CHAT domain-containing protein
MFQTAQWARSSEAAASLAQMAVRGAAGKPELATNVRERQDLVAEWQKRDAARSTAVSQPPDKRDKKTEAANVARLVEIDTRIGEIDTQLARVFPDYAALVSPKPLSVADVQSQLHDNEALVLFLDTPEWKPTPEETFVWVVTKTDSRWVKSVIGTKGLQDRVAALRCGLDYDGSWGALASHCAELLKITYSEADHESGKPLPFDINRSYELYQALFGQIEDIIKDKHLLIVPSGPLTQLPFQVLVTGLPHDVFWGERVREVGLLGAELRSWTDGQRKQLHLSDERGVGIVRSAKGGPAETAGLKPSDILLSVGRTDVAGVQQAVDAVRALAPHSTVELRLLRDGKEIGVSVSLGATTVRDWIPHFLDPTTRDVSWLIRDHALTVLPSVSSLRALRQLAKDSHASRALIGFGDPLLDGQPARYPEDGPRAVLARANQSCPKEPSEQIASLRGERRGVRPLALRGGMADVVQIRMQVPLPETANELCAVAHDLGVSGDDIRLGEHATETEIKRLSQSGELAKYRIVHLATHGALAGQVSGDSEPGLLLTPPEKATEIDDGYLSASEIAGLKLDADWVILSACNTAAGGAEGAEALSGLARAFFYAGARALLVSHWSVYSDATVKLITKAVSTMAADASVGRSEALRRSMLDLIEKGKPYEAQPAFWAPFVVVGEGGVSFKVATVAEPHSDDTSAVVPAISTPATPPTVVEPAKPPPVGKKMKRKPGSADDWFTGIFGQ